MAVDEVLSASQAMLGQSLPRPLSDEDTALPIDSAVPMALKRRSHYIPSAERTEISWEDRQCESEVQGVRAARKLRKALSWQSVSDSEENPPARRGGNTICSSLRGVGARRKVLMYARNLVGGFLLKSID